MHGDARADRGVILHERNVRLEALTARELGDALQNVRRDVATENSALFDFIQRSPRRGFNLLPESLVFDGNRHREDAPVRQVQI